MAEVLQTDFLPTAEWTLVRTPIGLANSPEELAAADPALLTRLDCQVPGTAAAAWRDAFGIAAALELDADAWDWWFIANFSVDSPDVLATFESAGIASYATVWLNDQLVLQSTGAFDALSAELELRVGENQLAIHCRSLSTVQTPRKPRARWRSALVSNSSIRWHRTQLLGHIPWPGTAKTVGPWGALSLRPSASFTVDKVWTELQSGDGTVRIQLHGHRTATIRAWITDLDGSQLAEEHLNLAGDTELSLKVSEPELWFPHSHGQARLYQLSITDGETTERFEVGFRKVEVSRADGGFELSVNGLALFCRGAVWQPLDALSLNGSEQDYQQAIALMVRAGVNMLRISGTGSYEQPAFYRECDRQGVMVWHDLMLATLDPPEDAAWLEHFRAESRSWLRRLAVHPSLTVLSGGNETEQQPTLWGLAAEARRMTVIDQLIPELVAAELPAVGQLSSSPSGGASPIEIRQGVSHYFGVGAYQLPLSDARTSGVRFAAECLAFANPPEPSAVERFFPGSQHASEAPAGWQRGIAADPGANWTFEDTSAHYVQEFFEAEPSASWARRLDLHRAANYHAIYRSLVEWRRPASPCAGAIVLAARDFIPGAGWGLTDSEGRPKSAWYAVKAAATSTALAFVPEGLNGTDLHVFHDGSTALDGTLKITVNSVSGVLVGGSESSVQLAANSSAHWSLDELLGGFRDLDYVWKFGEREYDSLTAVLFDGQGEELCRTVHPLGGIRRERLETGLQAVALDTEWLEVSTQKLATFVALDLVDHQPEDNYFHLAAGSSRRIRCLAQSTGSASEITGTVRALNDSTSTKTVQRAAESTTEGIPL